MGKPGRSTVLLAYRRGRRMAYRYIVSDCLDRQSVTACSYLILAIQYLARHGYLCEAHRLSELNELLLTRLQELA